MKIFVNGKETILSENSSVQDFVNGSDFSNRPFAIEKNTQIVSKANYSETFLSEGDKIEVITLCAGG